MIYNLGRVVPIFKGDYNSATTYNFLDVVFYDNSSFVALDTTTGSLPTDTTHWLPVALKGTTQSPTPAQMQEIKTEVEQYIVQNTIVDNLSSTDTDKSLSANQGRKLGFEPEVVELVGDGNNVQLRRVYCLANHTYRIIPDKTNIDFSGVSTQSTLFGIFNFDETLSSYTTLYNKPSSDTSPLNEYYDVVPVQNGYLQLNLRATVGEVLRLKIVFEPSDNECKNGDIYKSASSEVVMGLNEKLRDLTLTETKAIPYRTINDKYIKAADGLYGTLSSSYNVKLEIYDVSQYRFVRFIGAVSTSSLSSGYCFTDENDNLDNPVAANVISYSGFEQDTTLPTTYALKEYILEVPNGAKWFKTESNLNPQIFPTFLTDYYCYLEKGTILTDYVKETDNSKLINPPVNSVAMASDVLNVDGYIDYPDYTETKSTANLRLDGWIRGDNGNVASGTNTYYTVIDVEGYDKVRFLGVIWPSSATSVAGWAFYYEDDTVIPGTPTIVDKSPEISEVSKKEYIVDVPQSAKYFKCCTSFGGGLVNPDNAYFYLIKGSTIDCKIHNGEFCTYGQLFRYDFLNTTSHGDGSFTPNFDTTKLIGSYSDNNLTANGYTAGSSFSSYVNINTVCSINNFSYKAKIKLSDFTSIVGLGSIDYRTNGLRGSLVKFDFNTKTIKVCAKTHGTTEQTTVKYTYDISSVVDTNDTYIIEVGRINRAIYAKITNFTNCNSIKYVCPVSDVSPNGQTAPDSYPIGCFYDTLTFSQISGTQAYFQEISCYIPSNVKVAFIGDSITEGYGVHPDYCWASMACKYLGNSINMGRNGSVIDLAQIQVEDMLPIIKPKYAVITIGTNDITPTTPTINATKLNTLVSTVKSMGIIPIINTIFRRTSTYDSRFNQLNQDILGLHEITCRFDIATSTDFNLNSTQNTSLYISDNLHLNKEGNRVVYNRFMNDIGYTIKGNVDLY